MRSLLRSTAAVVSLGSACGSSIRFSSGNAPTGGGTTSKSETVSEGSQQQQKGLPKPFLANTPTAGIPEPPEAELDPFRVGYNMGMLSVQLETLRMKLEDNKEVIKTQFASLRDSSRANHDVITHTLGDNRGIVTQQLQQNLDKIIGRMEAVSARFSTTEEMLKEISKQQFEASQKHIDDRLENIKDTIKAGVLILAALQIWIIALLTTNYGSHRSGHGHGHGQAQGQSQGQGQQGGHGHGAASHEDPPKGEGPGFWKKATGGSAPSHY